MARILNEDVCRKTCYSRIMSVKRHASSVYYCYGAMGRLSKEQVPMYCPSPTNKDEARLKAREIGYLPRKRRKLPPLA